MKFKIDNMEKAFIKYGYHAEPEYNLSRMRLASKLIEKVSTSFYEMEYWDYIYDKDFNRIDNIDLYLAANKHNYRRCDKIFSSRDGLSNFKTRNFKEACAMDIGYYKQKKAKRILFKLLIHKLVMCYGDGNAQGVVIVGRAEDQLAGVVTLNCDEMEASQLMLAANDFFGFLNTLGAPPKENFN